MEFLITGSVAYDYLMTFPGYFRDHILPEHIDSISLSFLVDSMTRLEGGIAPNIAYTLALLGRRSRLWATVGEDFSSYRARLESIGVDTSGAKVVAGVYTASFFANTDRSNAQIASFYPGAMAYAAQHSLRELEGPAPDMVLISPNDPAAMNLFVRECQELEIPYIYDPSQQLARLDPQDVLDGTEGALALFVNEYEFRLIEKHTGLPPEKILHRDPAGPEDAVPFAVVTRGKDGADIHAEGRVIHVPIVAPDQIVDPTGVGDAFRGGFLAGYAYGLDWETCGRMGVLAATYCLEQRGTQAHKFTPESFVKRFRAHFDDQGRLDVLLTLQSI